MLMDNLRTILIKILKMKHYDKRGGDPHTWQLFGDTYICSHTWLPVTFTNTSHSADITSFIEVTTS